MVAVGQRQVLQDNVMYTVVQSNLVLHCKRCRCCAAANVYLSAIILLSTHRASGILWFSECAVVGRVESLLQGGVELQGVREGL